MAASGNVLARSASSPSEVSVQTPVLEDGPVMQDLATASKVLDVNTRYAYLLWCRDFAKTSVVARVEGRLAGFITGYRRPDSPQTLMVWQVAVAAEARGLGVAGRMLDELVARVPDVDHLETSITPDNEASIALFTGFARRRSADVTRSELFSAERLGGEQPEMLYRIGPFTV